MSAFNTKSKCFVSQKYSELRFLENGDLSCVIEIVLNDSVQHVVDGVVLPGDDVLQASIIYAGDVIAQRQVSALEPVKRGFPRGFAVVRHRTPINIRRR